MVSVMDYSYTAEFTDYNKDYHSTKSRAKEFTFLCCWSFYFLSMMIGSLAFFNNVTVFTDDMSMFTRIGYIIAIVVVYLVTGIIFIVGACYYCHWKHKHQVYDNDFVRV